MTPRASAMPTPAPSPVPPAVAPRPRARRTVGLDDKYRLEDGTVVLSGVQALVRGAFDQLRRDARAGMNTAGFVSGYQGSPLGGLDKEVEREAALAAELGLVHRPGLNEELAATSLMGSQLAASIPRARVDGVVGTWYGKAPGVDRASDAIRHANLAGTSPAGGVLLLAGDDPAAKSSTVPAASEALLAALHVPVLSPGNAQECIDLALHGYALSRASGLWAALKVVTDVADGAGTALVAPGRVRPVRPAVEWNGRPFLHTPTAHLLNPVTSELERSLHEARLPTAVEYARLNGLNEISGARDAWLGIVAAGKTHHDVRQALADLGLDESDLERRGVRLLRVGMIWPLEPTIVREFSRGLAEILVVEEKRPFLEQAVRDVLYGTADAPRVLGKHDETGAPLLPAAGELDADAAALAIGARLAARGLDLPSARARLDAIRAARARLAAPLAAGAVARTPFFCSGCPHSTSTKAPDGAVVGGGIGCHTMVLLNPAGKGDLTGITQMGGEGAQFIGIAPFTDTPHFFQNLGDGTFHHSGSLAIRAAVAADLPVTYKILANGTVAMTGAQDIEGHLPVPELTRWLALEGVRRIIVTTEDPSRYARADLAGIAEVRPRSELLAAQEELAREPGVTALVHDQACAAEKRRRTKRGLIPPPPRRVAINERVCEGCGDCGEKSGCLSVLPVETEYGRKTRIHQASCNTDLSCLEGDCPSFVTVVPAKGARAARPAAPSPPPLPDPPVLPARETTRIRLVGIGGTGVVTVAQILGMAAVLDGLHLAALDQTGLAQKGGPVVSDLVLAEAAVEGSGKIGAGGADVLIGLDVLATAAPKMLAVGDPGRTAAIVSTSAVPTGRMVIDPDARFPRLSRLLDAIGAVSGADNVHLDAQALAQRLFADHMPANAIVLGAAFQRGVLPMTQASLEAAFRLNGAAVETNLLAFAWGRAVVAAPDAVAALGDLAPDVVPGAAPAPAEPSPEALDALVARRAAELVRYGSRRWAARYETAVARVAQIERDRVPGRTALAAAYAEGLFKLMAYKDEYEVARLHLDPEQRARIEAEHGPGAKVSIQLHPPVLRALGLRRKIGFGPRTTPLLRLLVALRRLRGTPLDPFGHAHVRRVERELIREYTELVDRTIDTLSPATHARAVEIARLPELVRGYEGVKLASVERFRARAAELAAR